MSDSPFGSAARYQPAEYFDLAGSRVARRFGDVADEYALLRESAGLVDRGDRAILRVTGADRATWLHNMVTNAVRTLDPGSGVYAFACDAKGRVQFDVNILMLTDAILLDLDRAVLDRALAHLNRFLIMEAAELFDERDRWARIGCGGAGVAAVATALEMSHFPAMPDLAHFEVEGGARVVKTDFTGAPAFELIVPVENAATWWDRLHSLGARPVGYAAMDVMRIEAAVPWLGRDIDDTTLPAETGQVERGISYHKGCYLGQEIIERMRAYGSLARSLVKVRIVDGEGIVTPTPIFHGETDAGRLTSLVKHPVDAGWIGLGYLRTKVKTREGLAVGQPPRELVVI
ncbi:MAG: folate-binding protein YgfZ [Phycisphaerales bacterium]|nr:folate-binding protein YgfZ [Phycisphaerales bacterium]